MSAPATTKVFGIKLGVDPKILVGVLVVLAGVIFWYNSQADEAPGASAKSTAVRRDIPSTPVPATAAPKNRGPVRRTSAQQLTNDRGTLRLRPVDATRGDIDPTLHLDLLSRLQAVTPAASTRSLFEIGTSAAAGAGGLGPGGTAPLKGPVILPKPIAALPPPPVSTTPSAPVVNIPLRYYGFVRPAEIGRTNSGLFLDGENVVVATEGTVVKQRFLIVELTPASARVEDTQLRQGQTLTVIPVANP